MDFKERQEYFKKIHDSAYGSLVNPDETNLKDKEEVLRQVDIWNKTAEFMGYGILKAPNLKEFVPFYFNRRFPGNKFCVETEEGLFSPAKDYDAVEDEILTKYMEMFHIKEGWIPTIDYNHTKQCESKLLDEGKYNEIKINNFYSEKGSMGAKYLGINIVTITYSESPYNKGVIGKGPSELEAICDASIKFYERKMKRGKQLKIKEFVMIE